MVYFPFRKCCQTLFRPVLKESNLLQSSTGEGNTFQSNVVRGKKLKFVFSSIRDWSIFVIFYCIMGNTSVNGIFPF